MTPRHADPAHAAATETAILEAARDLMADRGLVGLSMRAVAARVGRSATTIYNYFENKQALVDRVVETGFRRFEAYLRAAIERHAPGSPDRLYVLGEAYIRFALENREYFKVIFTLDTEPAPCVEDLPGGSGYLMLRQAVVDAMDRGNIRRDDPDLVALYLWAHVHGLVTLFLTCNPARPHGGAGPIGATELFARFRDFVRNGLRPEVSGGVETPAALGT